jgi:hypothetical protein
MKLDEINKSIDIETLKLFEKFVKENLWIEKVNLYTRSFLTAVSGGATSYSLYMGLSSLNEGKILPAFLSGVATGIGAFTTYKSFLYTKQIYNKVQNIKQDLEDLKGDSEKEKSKLARSI